MGRTKRVWIGHRVFQWPETWSERLEQAVTPEAEVEAARIGQWILTWNRLALGGQTSRVKRRTESFILLSDARIRHRVCVDLALDPQMDQPAAAETVVVPLAFHRKGPMAQFDLRNEGDDALSLLNTSETQVLTYLVLRNTARNVLGYEPCDSATDFLQAVVMIDETEGERLLSVLESVRGDPTLTLGPEPGRLWQDSVFRALVKALAANFLLSTRLKPRDGLRRIVKYAYTDSLVVVQKPSRLREKLADRLGLVPLKLNIRNVIVDLSTSYHADLAPPAGLQLAGVDLLEPTEDPRRWRRLTAATTDPGLAHLRFAAGELPLEQPLKYDPELAVDLWPSGCAVVLQSRASAVLNAAILGAGLIVRLVTPLRPQQGLASAVLVAVPGTLSLIVAAQESSLVQRGLRAVRYRLLLSIVVSFGAATTLALRSWSPEWHLAAWICLTVVAGLNLVWLIAVETLRHLRPRRRIAGSPL